jgi:hypothetical protein
MSHIDIDIGGFFIKFNKKDHIFTVDETISGSLFLKLRNSIKANGLYIRIVGKLGVLWRDSDYTDADAEHNEPFSTLENFLDERITFLKPSDTGESVTIEKGDHEFKFSFRLVDFIKGGQVTQAKINASFPFSSEHEYGNVKYIITGILPRSLNDYDYQTVQFVKVISSLSDSGDMHRHFLPYKAEQTKDNSLLSGSSTSSSSSGSMSGSKSSLKVIVNKTAFKPGETINALLRLENDSSMRKFNKIYVKLIQVAVFHSKEPTSQYKVCKHDIFSYKQSDFDNHRLYEMDELIQIPKSTQPPSTLDPAHHIQYKYELKIELYTALKFVPTGSGQPLEVTVPIIIYNHLIEDGTRV